ncbi:MAG: ATP-binding protein [Candidatus Binatia bacterium]
MLPFLFTLVCLFVFAALSMKILSSVRAYVGGEGLWSKGQKQAVYHLTRYASSGDPADFELYRAAIAVPLGDRKARVELEKRDPDYQVARQGFLEGRNDPGDVDGMIRLFRRFRNFEPIDRSIAIWAAADEYIARLTQLAETLRDEVERKPGDPAKIRQVLVEIDRVAAVLTPLADAFSYTLGEGSRKIALTLIGLLAIATAVLTAFVVLIARAILRERERHQQALHESEERYRAFFETSIDAVILANENGSVEAVNPAACIAFGCSEYELKEAGSDWMRGDTLDSLRLALREGSRTGRYRGNLPLRRKDESTFIGEVSSSRFADPSGRPRISVIIRDISERVRAEEEVRRLNASLEERVAARTAELEAANRELEVNNRELESFCYSVSHDLRLPLRSMSGFSEILIDDHGHVLGERGMAHLERIQGACRRMGHLIDDLLSLTRYTRQKLVPTRIDLGAIAREIVEELEAEHSGRRVDVRIEPDLITRADAALVRVLLRCLLTNAWKFSAGQAEPRIEIGSRVDGAETVYYVRDNGCGFEAAYAGQLFRIFNRLHAADEFGGTGIGLAIVQRIVLRHGGRVWAESAPEQGATFYFTLAELAAEQGADAVPPA